MGRQVPKMPPLSAALRPDLAADVRTSETVHAVADGALPLHLRALVDPLSPINVILPDPLDLFGPY